MAEYLNSNVVAAALANNNARFVSVTFDKKNGETVERHGQKATNRRVGNIKGQKQSERMQAAKQVWLDYPVDKVNDSGRVQKGFSFNLEKVRRLNVGGMVLAANG